MFTECYCWSDEFEDRQSTATYPSDCVDDLAACLLGEAFGAL
jgi:hypothetical protein